MSYKLEGRILEVCDCKVLCPCWIGEDPDNGTCQSVVAYRFDKGMIDDVDVSGLTLALANFIPGNVLKGNWRVAIFVDERASEAQYQALLSVYRGERGGPLADFSKLFGDIISTERAEIHFDVEEGRGTLKVGGTAYAELEPYRGPTGEPTTLVESVFSTIPGSPAFVGKASVYRMRNPALGVDLDLTGHNAIQGNFTFQY